MAKNFLTWLFGSPSPAYPGVGLWHSNAVQVMRSLNPHALIAEEGGCAVLIEEHFDCDTDRRLYKLEYRSTFDAQHAIAFCLFNPWGGQGNPSAGSPVTESHVFSNGMLCLSSEHANSPQQSSLSLHTVILRARYWCTAFSVYKETGTFPNPS